MSKCKICSKEYERKMNGQTVCSYECSLEYGRKSVKKKKDSEARAEKKKLLNGDIRHLKDVAQYNFNRYIRLVRDRDLPCISCGHVFVLKNGKPSRQAHAGHYKPQGGYGYLRFNEMNVHKQCSICNNYKSGNLVDYRVALIEKIGIDEVEILERPNEIKKWEAEELLEIIAIYKNKVKDIK